ncbi:hypothetical protein KCP71_10785 [Salmonella enterica subsp. enterica]|nr:hypothetical protein KCP71_10785 [Salmonella enterica subsp. enterica]
MVDRIVPAMTPEQFDMIKDQIGFADPAASYARISVSGLSNNFVASLVLTGIKQGDVRLGRASYEEMKLRMLNSGHSFSRL